MPFSLFKKKEEREKEQNYDLNEDKHKILGRRQLIHVHTHTTEMTFSTVHSPQGIL